MDNSKSRIASNSCPRLPSHMYTMDCIGWHYQQPETMTMIAGCWRASERTVLKFTGGPSHGWVAPPTPTPPLVRTASLNMWLRTAAVILVDGHESQLLAAVL